ncbi:MAG: hypothetical protein R2867_10405 [Caldilineaceae bacterium]
MSRWDLQLPANTVTSGELGHTQLAVNVWAGSSQSTVSCAFDNGAETGGTQSPFARDPFAIARQQAADSLDARKPQLAEPVATPITRQIGPENWMQTNASWHIWTCPLPADLEAGAHRVTVVVDDTSARSLPSPICFDLGDGVTGYCAVVPLLYPFVGCIGYQRTCSLWFTEDNGQTLNCSSSSIVSSSFTGRMTPRNVSKKHALSLFDNACF